MHSGQKHIIDTVSKAVEDFKSMQPDIPWYSARVDDFDGRIRYEAYGPKDSFVRFEGPNAKADCDVFMTAIIATK